MKIINLTCALLMCAFISVSQASVIHITDASGKLLGAQNVEVNGTLYDVAFLDGTCVELFDGCDDANDFMFNTFLDADLAARALINLVFVDVNNESQFDSRPELMNGCSDVIACGIWTPYSPMFNNNYAEFMYVNAINAYCVNCDYTPGDFGHNPKTRDSSVDDTLVFARWTVATSVPEPGTAILLSLGIAGMCLSRRRKSL